MWQLNLIFIEEFYRIMGACFKVCKDKGGGFLEPVYQECLSLELGLLDNFGLYPKVEYARIVRQMKK